MASRSDVWPSLALSLWPHRELRPNTMPMTHVLQITKNGFCLSTYIRYPKLVMHNLVALFTRQWKNFFTSIIKGHNGDNEILWFLTLLPYKDKIWALCIAVKTWDVQRVLIIPYTGYKPRECPHVVSSTSHLNCPVNCIATSIETLNRIFPTDENIRANALFTILSQPRITAS